jgi:hypothetical protein
MDRDDNEGMSFTEFSYQVRTLLPRSDDVRTTSWWLAGGSGGGGNGGWWLVGLTNGEQRDGWMGGWCGRVTRCCRATTS